MEAFPSCPKPLFQSEAKCEAIDIKTTVILIQIKLIFTAKVLHLASFWKWEFLELGSGLFWFFFFYIKETLLCMPSHQNLHTSKIIHTAEKERGREGEAVTVAFFAKTRPLKESLWWALQGDISIMGYDTAGENLNLHLTLTLGYLNPALNNSALILSTNSHFFSLYFHGLGLWHEAYSQ